MIKNDWRTKNCQKDAKKKRFKDDHFDDSFKRKNYLKQKNKNVR